MVGTRDFWLWTESFGLYYRRLNMVGYSLFKDSTNEVTISMFSLGQMILVVEEELCIVWLLEIVTNGLLFV